MSNYAVLRGAAYTLAADRIWFCTMEQRRL